MLCLYVGVVMALSINPHNTQPGLLTTAIQSQPHWGYVRPSHHDVNRRQRCGVRGGEEEEGGWSL